MANPVISVGTGQIIPLTPDPNQTFEVPVNLGNTVKSLLVTLRYNEIADFWVMTIADINNNVIVDSIPFVTGVVPGGNLLGQYAYLDIGAAYILNASGVASPNYPGSTDLGTDFVLLWDVVPPQGLSVKVIQNGHPVHGGNPPRPPGPVD